MNSVFDGIRQFLVTCSGEDNSILKKCRPIIQYRFALLGFFVLLIFIGCFCSAAFFTYSLFDTAKWLSIPLGIVWGAVVVNLYLLLLHTISPPIIPLSTKKKKNELLRSSISERFSFPSSSMLSRIGFIVLLAMIIAQPISVFSLSSTVNSLIEAHKVEQRVQLYTLSNKRLIHQEIQEHQHFISQVANSLAPTDQQIVNAQFAFLTSKMSEDDLFLRNSLTMINRINSLKAHPTKESDAQKTSLINELNSMLEKELESDHAFLTELENVEINVGFGIEFSNYKKDLQYLIHQKISNYNALVDLLNRSNFYIMKIQLLLHHKIMAWIFTLIICIVFVLPVYFKYRVRDVSAKLFALETHTAEVKKLRNQLIHTTDFPWLKTTLLEIDLSKIITSDYYFRRMVIEHRIILEQYEESKQEYSKLLSERVLQYNRQCMQRLLVQLQQLKKAKPKKYLEFSKQLYEEYQDYVVMKFEYWIDCPFRTAHKPSPFDVKNNEGALLDFLYNDESKDT